MTHIRIISSDKNKINAIVRDLVKAYSIDPSREYAYNVQLQHGYRCEIIEDQGGILPILPICVKYSDEIRLRISVKTSNTNIIEREYTGMEFFKNYKDIYGIDFNHPEVEELEEKESSVSSQLTTLQDALVWYQKLNKADKAKADLIIDAFSAIKRGEEVQGLT